jgi:hypothetical protein
MRGRTAAADKQRLSVADAQPKAAFVALRIEASNELAERKRIGEAEAAEFARRHPENCGRRNGASLRSVVHKLSLSGCVPKFPAE